MRHAKSLINQEIDTDEGWGNAGMIPEGVLEIRRIQAQDDTGKAARTARVRRGGRWIISNAEEEHGGIRPPRTPRKSTRKSET